jgi:hypothetical protein
MKTTIAALLILGTITTQAQVKIWDDEGKNIKTKGTLLELESFDTNRNSGDKQMADAGFIAGFTVVGTVLPALINLGVTTAKSASAKKEEDYTKEYASLNGLDIDPKDVLDPKNTAGIKCKFSYFENGKTVQDKMSEYKFEVGYNDSAQLLVMNILDSDEDYIPVKTKKKYDLVLEVFEFTFVAKVKIKEKDKTVTKILELGKAKVTRVMPSYRMEGTKKQLIFKDGMNLPSHTEKGEPISYEKISVSCSAKFVNPIGTTQSALNKFLEGSSDGVESLLNLTIKSE